VPLSHSGRWRDHFAGVDLPVPVLGGATVTGINFDNAASTPPLKRVRDAVTAFSDMYSSVHRGTGYKSRLATEAYEQARERVAEFLQVDDRSQVVIFVKGTTDALNRIAAEQARMDGRHVLVTEMEHHADLLPWRHRSGHVLVGLTPDGHIDLEAIEQALKRSEGKIGLVAISGASNVTGFISPIHEVAELAHRHGALVSVDAAQLAPHRRIDIRPADDPGHLDFVSFSGHKMYAPYGAGVLIGPRASFVEGDPFLAGGGAVDLVDLDEVMWTDPPEREEAGSPNVLGAVALGAAISELQSFGWDAIVAHEQAIAVRLRSGLAGMHGVRLLGPALDVPTLAVATFEIKDVPHALVAARLSAEFGIGVRHGCFCAHPYLMRLLDLPRDVVDRYRADIRIGDRRRIPGAVRASADLSTTTDDIDRLLAAIAIVADGSRAPVVYRQDAATGDYWPEGDAVPWVTGNRSLGASCSRG
jgi:cysteine desulfurase/selenocysteine lyase